MSSGKVLLGVLAGLAAGALLGVLFAPDKGTVTRKKIIKKSEDYAEGLKAKLDEFIDDINKKGEEVKKEAEKVISKAETIKKDVKSATS
jgi:gas vesicle protein